MLLGKADALLAERARMALADALAPIWATLQQPVASVRGGGAGGGILAEPAGRECGAAPAALFGARGGAGLPDGAGRRRWWRDLARALLRGIGPNHGVRKGQIA